MFLKKNNDFSEMCRHRESHHKDSPIEPILDWAYNKIKSHHYTECHDNVGQIAAYVLNIRYLRETEEQMMR